MIHLRPGDDAQLETMLHDLASGRPALHLIHPGPEEEDGAGNDTWVQDAALRLGLPARSSEAEVRAAGHLEVRVDAGDAVNTFLITPAHAARLPWLTAHLPRARA